MGSPLASAGVSFVPDGEGRTASGETDSEGNYTLTTFETGDGAIPGNYKIMVSSPRISDAELDKLKAAGTSTSQKSSTVPQKYGDIKTSGLTATVSESESNTVPVELKSGG